MTKLKNLTRKQLRAITALLVSIAVVVPGMLVFVVKGASSTEGTHLNFNMNQSTPTIEVGEDGLESGTFNVTYNGRTYVYDLQFQPGENEEISKLNGKLLKGDTLKFNKSTKEITWTYDPAHDTSLENIAPLITSRDNAENGTVALELKSGSGIKATLSNDATYYYFDSASNNYYLLNIADTFIGYQAGDDENNYEATPVYQYQRAITDAQYINSQKNPLTITVNKDGSSAILTGDQLKRRQIYVETTVLSDKGVYLIQSSDGTFLTATNSRNTAQEDRGRSHYDNCQFASSSNKHKYYPLESHDYIKSTYTPSTFELYKKDGAPYLENQLSSFYGGDENEEELAFSEYRSKATTHSVHEETAYTCYYLFGFEKDDETGHYTSDKTLGEMFTETPYGVVLYDLCEGSSQVPYGLTNLAYHNYHHNDNSLWRFSNRQLYTNYRRVARDADTLTGYLNKTSDTSFELSDSASDGFKLYKRQSAYAVSESFNKEVSLDLDKLVTKDVAPSSISYEESETTDSGLELKKVVSKTASDDIFDVTLEAHMTKEKLTRPDTDIEIVLDTSLAMDNKVYSRKYENLKTYSLFEAVSTSDITHDNMYDNDSDGASFLEYIRRLGNDVWDDLVKGRLFKHNKYVEDPNAPGTYVYLHQEYFGKPGGDGSVTLFTNYYRYYFTSANGETYSTYDTSTTNSEHPGCFIEALRTTAFTKPKLTNGLTFYKNGNAADPHPIHVDTIYHVPGYTNVENAEPSLTKNLYPYANAGQLYTKIDGEYKQVRVYTDNQGMYTYFVKDNDDTLVSNATYKFTTGGKQKLQVSGTHYSGEYSVFQGFRHYVLTTNDEGETVYRLDDTQGNLLSKTLYIKHNTDYDVSGLTAMQEALEEFLLKAHERAVENDATIHVGLVTYDKSSYIDYALNVIDMGNPVGTNTVDTLISHIYNINVSDTAKGGHNTWAAELGQGMHTAYTQMRTLSRAGSKRFTLVFTGGKPIEYRTGLNWRLQRVDKTAKDDDFSTYIANDAIEVADDFKNTLKSTVYTVGAYDNASASKINGRAWYYAWRETWLCDGNPGTHAYWGGSWLANLAGYNIDPSDAYATNRMLDYMSSNYSNATTLGVDRGRYAPGSAKNFIDWIAKQASKTYGYKITHNYSKTDNGFFFGLSPNTLNDETDSETEPVPEELNENAFKEAMRNILAGLQKATEVAKNKLDASAWLVDGITPYFDLVEGLDGITAKIVSLEDGSEVATLTSANGDVVYDPDTKTISVKGFDYKDHFVGSESPQKLVATFQIQRDGDFIGGNYVPTNQTKSAVYDGQGIDPGVLVERFDIPHVDLKLLDINNFVQDDSVYYACVEDLSELINPIWVDGYRNSYVDITYEIYKKTSDTTNEYVNTYKIEHGDTSGSWTNEIGENDANLDKTYPTMTDTTQYLVKVVVDPVPVHEGSYGAKTRENDPATVYVFKPHYDLHDGEVDEYGTDTPRSQFDLTSVPDLSWEVYGSDGNLIANDTDLRKMLPKDDGGELIVPEIAHGFENLTETNRAVTDADKGAYKINLETTFKVNPVTIKPSSFTYMSHENVTHYYDGEGNEITKDEYDAISGDQKSSEEIMEWVAKEKTYDQPQTIPAEDVSFTNSDHTDWTDGRFLVKSKGHDVTIYNEVAIGDNDADFRDTESPFPLTLTLKDKAGNNVSKTYDCILPDGTTSTIEFNDGEVVKIGDKAVSDSTIGVAHEKSFVIKQLDDGYMLSVASPLSDAYVASYMTGEDANNLSDKDATDEAIEATIATNQKYIKVTQTMNKVVITGLGNSDSKLNPFFIAAAIVALLGGAGTGYAVKRKKETEA